MRDETNHRERMDDFSEFMKRKLEDHRLTVDETGWSEMESRLNSRHHSPAKWIGGLMAVAAAAIALLLLLPDDAGVVPEVIEKEWVTVENRIPENKEIPNHHQTVTQQLPDTKIAATLANKSPKEVVLSEPTSEEKPAEPVDSVPQVTPSKERKEKWEDKNRYDVRKKTFAKNNRIKKNQREWLLAAAIGSGGNISLNGNSNMYDDSNQSLQDPSTNPIFPKPPTLNNGSYPLENYQDVSHSLPLSFGITARKNLNKHIALESGLVYTYLTSKYKQTGERRYNTRVNQHYLGVPVNLVVYLWNNPKWNIYFSGGILMEKGLRLTQVQNILQNQSFASSTIVKENIDGLQWSLNASAGFSYSLYREWSLYFEPKISYYFDSGQPASIRTDRTVLFGLAAGVRYEF